MYQNKFRMIFFCTLLVFISASYVQSSPDSGRITVSFANGKFSEISALENLIKEAELLRLNTEYSADGTDIPPTRYWATADAHNEFQNAIDTAKAVLENNFTNELSPGESFHMYLRLENNPGFVTMELRLFIPAGLELTHISSLIDMEVTMPDGHSQETGEIPAIVGPGYAYVICMGVSPFDVSDSDILVYTFNVTEDASAGKTEPITLAFANALGSSNPLNEYGRHVNIALPNNGVLGDIVVKGQ